MLDNFAVLHRQKAPVAESGGFVLNTCLRGIWAGSRRDLMAVEQVKGDRVLVGLDAVVFLTEIACGLHAPTIGETEVFGQFRKAVFGSSSEFRSLLLKVIEIAKKVRHLYLRNLGSGSYGSFCRRTLRDLPEVAIIGSGQLADEIIPWLNKEDAKVRIYCRRPEQVQQKWPELEVKYFTGEMRGQALVIAAPIAAGQVLNPDQFERIVDLRAESRQDPINVPHLALDAVFEAFGQQKTQAHTQKRLAIAEIESRCQEIQDQVQHRPMGWDDLCMC